MNLRVQAVPLDAPQPTERLVKRGALSLFLAVRSAVAYSKELPAILGQAATDIREAWEESSRPNA